MMTVSKSLAMALKLVWLNHLYAGRGKIGWIGKIKKKWVSWVKAASTVSFINPYATTKVKWRKGQVIDSFWKILKYTNSIILFIINELVQSVSISRIQRIQIQIMSFFSKTINSPYISLYSLMISSLLSYLINSAFYNISNIILIILKV